MKKTWIMAIVAVMLVTALLTGCQESSTSREAQQQEVLLQQAVSQTGMPAIKNFREKKILKEIYELRDQNGLTTYTYIVAEMTGKLVFIGETIGYGIPAATQYTNPQKRDYGNGSTPIALPQADPNGLYSPASADGTWVLMKDPNGKEVKPVYIEPRIIVSPFRLDI